MLTRPRLKLGCVLASALCMMLIMACFLTGAVIQRRAVAPPTIHLALGSFHIVAYGTNRPDCPPYGGRKPLVSAICGADSILHTTYDLSAAGAPADRINAFYCGACKVGRAKGCAARPLFFWWLRCGFAAPRPPEGNIRGGFASPTPT